ncbi:MAG: cadherin repeat domain-containing protein [Planctomycetota bacterium]|nr:MAG: cadherin repeat domain-containing protein [Planctomycetota bacterium]
MVISAIESRMLLAGMTAQLDSLGAVSGGVASANISGTVTGFADGTMITIMEGNTYVGSGGSYDDMFSASATLGVGTHVLTIKADGTNVVTGVYESVSTTLSVTVNAGNSATSITAQLDSLGAVSGGSASANISGTVTGFSGSTMITITEGGNYVGSGYGYEGTYSGYATLGIGTHTLTVTAEGANAVTGVYESVSTTLSVTVNAGNSATSITAQLNSLGAVSGGSAIANISGTVTGFSGSTMISITLLGNPVGYGYGSDGTFSGYASVGIGTHTLVITAEGTNAVTGAYESVSTTLEVTVTAGSSATSITAQLDSLGAVSGGFASANISGTLSGFSGSTMITITEGGNYVGSGYGYDGTYSGYAYLGIGTHNLTVTAEGTNVVTGVTESVSAPLSVAVVGVPPVITSNGGGETAQLDMAENQTTVTTVTASGSSLRYSLSGGADAGKFSIDQYTGNLTFISAPDFESPNDTDYDNLFEVAVMVTDVSQTTNSTDIQTIFVTVTDVGPIAVDDVISFGQNDNQVSFDPTGNDTVGPTYSWTPGAPQQGGLQNPSFVALGYPSFGNSLVDIQPGQPVTYTPSVDPLSLGDMASEISRLEAEITTWHESIETAIDALKENSVDAINDAAGFMEDWFDDQAYWDTLSASLAVGVIGAEIGGYPGAIYGVIVGAMAESIGQYIAGSPFDEALAAAKEKIRDAWETARREVDTLAAKMRRDLATFIGTLGNPDRIENDTFDYVVKSGGESSTGTIVIDFQGRLNYSSIVMALKSYKTQGMVTLNVPSALAIQGQLILGLGSSRGMRVSWEYNGVPLASTGSPYRWVPATATTNWPWGFDEFALADALNSIGYTPYTH